MDFSAAEGLNDWGTGSRIVEAIAEFLAQDGVFVLLAIVAILFLRSATGRRGASAAGFAAVIALLLGHFISGAVDRVRPFVDHPQIHLLIHHARDAGFPSDHATGAFAIAVALFLRDRVAGGIALVLATLVALSRVIVGAHYPTDVLAGAALGGGVALLLWLPPARRLTDAVGNAAGSLYERSLAWTRSVPSGARPSRPT